MFCLLGRLFALWAVLCRYCNVALDLVCVVSLLLIMSVLWYYVICLFLVVLVYLVLRLFGCYVGDCLIVV